MVKSTDSIVMLNRLRCFTILMTLLTANIDGLAQLKPRVKGLPPYRLPDKPIDQERVSRLKSMLYREEMLSENDTAYLKRAIEARMSPEELAKWQQNEFYGKTPLTEIAAKGKGYGVDGGLYWDGQNVPPDSHIADANQILGLIQPLNAAGVPDNAGKVGFLSVGMLNASLAFSRFKELVDADPDKSAAVTIVDGAQPGRPTDSWQDSSPRAWKVVDERLGDAGLTKLQVQAIWFQPTTRQHHGKTNADLVLLLRTTQSFQKVFPNLRVIYFSSPAYSGFSVGTNDLEPAAYDMAFHLRVFITDQVKGLRVTRLRNARNGPDGLPLLLWGPYLWADGNKPRVSDGLQYLREDFISDGLHLSESGTMKVAKQLLEFFKSDPLAKSWFTK